MSTRAKWQNLQIFKIQDGRRPPFWKSLNRHMSVKNRPILIKFGTYSKCTDVTKNWNFKKIPDGGGRCLENRFFGHNSSTDFLISAKFCTRKQNSMLTKVMWQKLQIFQMQDGGRPPFWKSLNHHISVKIIRLLSDFDKIWCTTADVEPWVLQSSMVPSICKSYQSTWICSTAIDKTSTRTPFTYLRRALCQIGNKPFGIATPTRWFNIML